MCEGMKYEFGCGDVHFACCDVEDGEIVFAQAVNKDDFCSHGERKNRMTYRDDMLCDIKSIIRKVNEYEQRKI